MDPVSKPTTQRPPQVTFAAGLVIAGSIFVLAGNFSRVSTLRSLDNRQLVEDLVSEPGLSGLGLSVEDGFTILYASLVVGAVCAAVAAILGGFAMTGSRPARLGVTVVAVPMFVSGLMNAGFTTAFVAAAASMLWLSPGREWFRDGMWTPPEAPVRDDQRPRPLGGPPAQPPYGPGPGAQQPPQGPRPTLPGDGAAQPGPHPGWLAGPGQQGAPGQQGQPAAGRPSPYHQAPGAAYPYPGAQPVPGQPVPGQPGAPGVWQQAPAGPRPQSLRTVVLLTVLGGIAASFSYVRAAVTADHVEQFEQFRKQFPGLVEQAGYTADMFRLANYATAGMMVLWAVAAVVLALMVVRRQEWARILLLVSAAFTGPFCLLLGIAGDVLLLVPGVAAVVTLVALRAPDVKDWVNRR